MTWLLSIEGEQQYVESRSSGAQACGVARAAENRGRASAYQSSPGGGAAEPAASGVRHPLLEGRHSAFRQDYQILCTLFAMLPDLPMGYAVIPTSRGIP